MTPLTALWLPIVLSAVLVFIASTIIHMVVKWHDSDYSAVPDEAKMRAALAAVPIPPDDYIIPRAATMEQMRSPEFMEKMKNGPVMIFTVLPNGPVTMGRSLSLWFVFILVVGILAAYVTGRALPPGAEYLEVFRFAGTTAFIAYAAALWPMSIWYRRKWSTTIKSTIDGLIYGLLTAGVFGWLWP
ncbi:MAG TPA: hypothetical protein VMS56_12765 [Thermoanaerobaculia bacterium]|nr:hypothetical protein [Thermoanaerobaculia bacterium]